MVFLLLIPVLTSAISFLIYCTSIIEQSPINKCVVTKNNALVIDEKS